MEEENDVILQGLLLEQAAFLDAQKKPSTRSFSLSYWLEEETLLNGLLFSTQGTEIEINDNRESIPFDLALRRSIVPSSGPHVSLGHMLLCLRSQVPAQRCLALRFFQKLLSSLARGSSSSEKQKNEAILLLLLKKGLVPCTLGCLSDKSCTLNMLAKETMSAILALEQSVFYPVSP